MLKTTLLMLGAAWGRPERRQPHLMPARCSFQSPQHPLLGAVCCWRCILSLLLWCLLRGLLCGVACRLSPSLARGWLKLWLQSLSCLSSFQPSRRSSGRSCSSRRLGRAVSCRGSIRVCGLGLVLLGTCFISLSAVCQQAAGLQLPHEAGQLSRTPTVVH